METSDKGTMGASLTPGGEASEPRLRVLVLGDFSGAGGPEQTAARVDRSTFQELLGSLGPRLSFEVEDHLSGRSTPLRVEFAISELRDFTPAAIVQRVPALARATEVVASLSEASDPEARLAPVQEMEALCHAVRTSQAPPAAPPTDGSQDGAVGRILDMVDLPGEGEPVRTAAVAALDSFVSKVGSQRKTATRERTPTQADLLLGRQLDAILHHPELQRAEATWRGLKLLVDRTDFRKGIQLELLDARRETLADAFHQGVFLPEVEDFGQLPLALVVLDHPLTNSPGDLGLLETIGPEAEQIQAPVLFSVGTDFFGAQQGGRLPFIDTLLEQAEYTRWSALRDKSWARWLAAATNRFLLRLPHEGESPDALLWGNPVWAVASLVAASFARVGWPTELTGLEGGRIEDLPLPSGRHFPLETLLSQELANDLTAAGFIPLFSPAHSDAAFVLRAPTLHRAPRGGRLSSSLPYQLLAARLATAVLGQRTGLAGKSSPEIQQTLERFASELLADTGGGARAAVAVSEDPDDPSRLVVSLDLRTGRRVLGGARVELGFGVS